MSIDRQRATMPAATGRLLERRSLTDHHRRLAELLQPGLAVLDVGCGTGAITSGVADAVGPGGLAVGADLNHELLRQGRETGNRPPSLRLVQADVYTLPFVRAFDIVTAARVVQWLARPLDAVLAMSSAVRPGGRLIVLDYDHTRTEWTPLPPDSMRDFHAAFLAWRHAAGFDNAMARHLPSLLEAAGVANVVVTPQHETARRDQSDFTRRAGIWADVAATRGHQLVADRVITEAARAAAEREYRSWVESEAESMTLHLEAVEGTVPTG